MLSRKDLRHQAALRRHAPHVYNALNELREMGEILEIGLDGRVRRYDPNVSEAHHHLVCERCGAIRDVWPRSQARLALPRPSGTAS